MVLGPNGRTLRWMEPGRRRGSLSHRDIVAFRPTHRQIARRGGPTSQRRNRRPHRGAGTVSRGGLPAHGDGRSDLEEDGPSFEPLRRTERSQWTHNPTPQSPVACGGSIMVTSTHDAPPHRSPVPRRHRPDDSIDAGEATRVGSVPTHPWVTESPAAAVRNELHCASHESEPFDVAAPRADPSAPEPMPPTWETDQAFPRQEMERIRRKTQRLRSLRGQETEQDSVTEDGTDDAFVELPPGAFRHDTAAAAVPHGSRTVRGGSVRHLAVPPRPTPYRRLQPQPWTRDLTSSANSDANTVQDSLDDILNERDEATSSAQTPDPYEKEVSLCQQPQEVRLLYTIPQNSTHDETPEASQDDVEDYLTRDPSLWEACTADSSEASAFGERFFLATDSVRHAPSVASDATGSSIKPAGEDQNTPDTTHTTEATDASSFQLHDLCGEAASTDDIAWRNALFLLSTLPELAHVKEPDHQWTPLHIACMGASPMPLYILHALLFVHPHAARMPDAGGRLPLHLLAASSASVPVLQILVQEYPTALVTRDQQGFTPLHLLLRNVREELTVERAGILLGLPSLDHAAKPEPAANRRPHQVLQRRRQHWQMPPDEISAWLRRPKPVTVFHQPRVVHHEAVFQTFPQDVQLALKKLSKWKRSQTNVHTDEAIATNDSSAASERKEIANPAAMPSPCDNQLPVHLVVRRALIHRTTLVDDIDSQSFDSDSDDSDEDSTEPSDREVSSSPRVLRPSVPHPFDVLRLVVNAYPGGLVHRDSDGLTPLLLTMVDPDYTPDLDVIDLLLGRRTAGAFETLPGWSEDLTLHSCSNKRYMNPAMVPTTDSGQLPLHLASEEHLSDFSIIQSIRDSYPGAIHVQDKHGFTPLHVALLNYRRAVLEPRVLAALYSDRVAQIKDDFGRTPLDLLLKRTDAVPSKAPCEWDDDENREASAAYERLIIASLSECGASATVSQRNQLLRRLRVLPPWLRQQACSSSGVQKLIVDDLSSPWKSALIIMDGLLLATLISVFRIQMEEYIQALYTGVLLANWYTYLVYACASVRLIWNASLWLVLAKFGEFQHLCLFNVATWVDTSAMLLAMVTSVLLYGSEPEEKMLSLGTATTGMLWLTLLSYFSTWFQGMALFTGALRQIARWLLWPVLLVGSLCIAFAQMFYTQLQLDCETAFGVTSVCTVRDSFRVVYMLGRGETLTSMQINQPMSMEAVVLVTLFLVVAALFVVGLFVALLLMAAQLDMETLSTIYFWEPKLAAHFSLSDLGGPEKSQGTSRADLFYKKLDSIWDLLVFSLTRERSWKYLQWEMAGRLTSGPYVWLLPIMAIVVLPIWFVLGCFSFGLLWPNQVRRAIFRTSKVCQRSTYRSDQPAASEVNLMRHELAHVKSMAFSHSEEVNHKIHDIADMLQSLTKKAS